MSLTFKRNSGLLVALLLLTTGLIVGSVLLSCTGSPAFLEAEAQPAAASASTGHVTEESAATAAASATEAPEESAPAPTETGPAQGAGWSSAEATQIALEGDSASVEGAGASAAGSVVTISAGGTFVFRGSLRDGQVVVDSRAEEPVLLVLDGADIWSGSSAAIYIVNAEEVEIVLTEGSTNRLEDGSDYALAGGVDEPNAALFSRDDLSISGTGSLEVVGNSNDGVACKDTLTIRGGTLTVEAVDDGMRGKDSLAIEGGTVTITAGGDGLKSDNEEEAGPGTVLVAGGGVTIDTGGDGIDAQGEVIVTGGDVDITSGGGSGGRVAEGASAKGIKGTTAVRIEGGRLTIDSADDAVHSNGSIAVSGGTLALSSGDDALHADATLEVSDGEIIVGECYEGLESAVIRVRGGTIHLTASDDGINVSGGQDESGMMGGPGFRGRPGAGPGGGWAGQDTFTTGDQFLEVSGGYTLINAGGDGIDANGTIEMSKGVLIVNGPTESMNGALDFQGFKITGGLLVAAGSAGMAQAPGESSTQYSVLLSFGTRIQGGTLLRIVSEAGEEVLSFSPAKEYETLVLSSPDLEEATYRVTVGGRSSAVSRDGLYGEGDVEGAEDIGSFSVTGIVTQVGRSGRY